ncbi:MAG: hypothetical protein IJS50_03775, partial [Desulfovibrio sp.]|nr:hypothetical protein [Desulfovibrio sp.]
MNILPDTILTNNLSRSDLLSLPLPETFKDISVAVHRNHAFEYVASVLNVFLAQSGLKAQFWYSPYDDSLSFENIPKVDLHLLWLDGTRYQTSSTAEWLKDRIQALQSIAKAPILIFWYGEKISFKDLPSNCILYNLKEELSGLNGSIEDERLTPFSGTRLSNQACLESARILGLISIPPLFFPRIKALALDCDNTLYAGVLGEDGANKLKPYFSLQKKLQELKEEGVLLTLVSKNEEK